ncbi:unnamed protein product [Ixodes hexagonus]
MFCDMGKYRTCDHGCRHRPAKRIIPTTDGGACLVLETFRGDLVSYHTSEHGCFHYLAKLLVIGAAKASCPFHVNGGQHWKKKASLDCCYPFFGQVNNFFFILKHRPGVCTAAPHNKQHKHKCSLFTAFLAA